MRNPDHPNGRPDYELWAALIFFAGAASIFVLASFAYLIWWWFFR